MPMTLENLSGIGRLKPHSPTRVEIQRVLAAAEASLQDARREPIEQSKVVECIDAARQLLADVRAWLKANRPDLG